MRGDRDASREPSAQTAAVPSPPVKHREIAVTGSLRWAPVPFVAGPTVTATATSSRAATAEPDTPEVAAVIILTPPQTLAPGAPLDFRAVGLSLRGDIVVSDDFEWSTDAPAVLVVDSEDEIGSISINAADGAVAQLTASYTNPDNSVVTSQAVQFRVAAPVDQPGLTVSVVDADTGRPIGGATVAVDGERQVTDETGVVAFPNAVGAPTVTGFAADYDSDAGRTRYCRGYPSPAAQPAHPIDRVVFTGTVDYDRVSTQGAALSSD